MSGLRDQFKASSALCGANAAFIEELYERYLYDPQSVAPSWRHRFEEIRGKSVGETAHGPVRESFRRLAQAPPAAPKQQADSPPAAAAQQQQSAVLRLINSYRFRGHQAANLDPLKLREQPEIPDLDPAFHNLTEADNELIFHTGSLFAPDRLPLGEIIDLIQEAYCGSVGSEYMHITDTREKRWIQKRLESNLGRPDISVKGKRWLLALLTAAEGIERYFHTRYVGQKRFSLEGGEALIPMLDELVQRSGRYETHEIVIGMAHRGRLNVLTNILGKPPQVIFDEFEGRVEIETRAGDVKYHMGFSTDVETDGGIAHLVLGFNPSHLEIINPVIEGSVRARQQRLGDRRGAKVLPLLIHGDSAFAGQGVVMETLNLSQTRGYSTGGTVHIVVNNQIGFTASNPLDTRSTLYCTDVGKMVQAPVFHVNGDDPEAVIFVTRLALDFRMEFHKDVIIDMICYRRHGHNEADEPAVTQPMMYRKIRSHPTARHIYADRLIAQGIVDSDQCQRMVERYRSSIEQGVVEARPLLCALKHPYAVNWERFRNTPWSEPGDTRLPKERLQRLGLAMLDLPEGFELHSRVAKVWAERRKIALGEQLANWGFAENLAYATLLEDGYPVRLSGQDSGRGTFSHRHAMVHDQLTGESYTPLEHLSRSQPAFLVIDSILSEEAVLGFEYGYATAEPDTLTLWEAQFGDFSNVAQVVIDQFITSAGTKWDRYCALTMLLPHGYEGQGAEHSSARLERFLQLCAEHNIQVCVPTSPAQIYHLLRRQMIRPYRRPLVVMTPKSLLRHRLATSSLTELAEGCFEPVIGERETLDAQQVIRVIACSGKVYYDLLETRRAHGLENVAIIRIEQLYPFPKEQLAAAIEPFVQADEFIWCQEEPQNQGAWDQIKHRFHALLESGKKVFYVGRPAAGAPAVGQYRVHTKQQERLVDEALSGRINPSMNRRSP